MEKDSAISQRDLFLLGFLFLLETSVVAVLKALHVKGERTFDLFLSTRPGLVFLCAAVGCLIAAGGITNIYLAHRHSPSRYFRLIVAMNLVTVLLMLITGEVAVRASSRVYLDGEAFGKVALVPKNWETTRAHYRAILERASGDLSYLVSAVPTLRKIAICISQVIDSIKHAFRCAIEVGTRLRNFEHQAN